MGDRTATGNGLPANIRDLPLEVQVAVLYERVGYLTLEVRFMKRGFWALVLTILTASISLLAYTLGHGAGP